MKIAKMIGLGKWVNVRTLKSYNNLLQEKNYFHVNISNCHLCVQYCPHYLLVFFKTRKRREVNIFTESGNKKKQNLSTRPTVAYKVAIRKSTTSQNIHCQDENRSRQLNFYQLCRSPCT